MNFIKLKTFLIEKGITRAEVDHCPGKPSLLRLAAEHKFKSLLSDAIDSGNSRQIQNAIDEVNRHYGLDSSTPTDSSTPQGVGDLLETAVRLTKTPSSSSSPATHSEQQTSKAPLLCGMLWSVCTLGLSWIPYFQAKSNALTTHSLFTHYSNAHYSLTIHTSIKSLFMLKTQ